MRNGKLAKKKWSKLKGDPQKKGKKERDEKRELSKAPFKDFFSS